MIFSINDFFEYLNFFLRVVVLVYLVKRYVIDYIKDSIFQEKQEEFNLQKKDEALQEKIIEIDKNISKDQRYFESMQEKFRIWHGNVDKFDQKENVLCADRQKKIDILAYKKFENIQHRQLIKQEVLDLVGQVEMDLKKQYQMDKDFGKKYITNILDVIFEKKI